MDQYRCSALFVSRVSGIPLSTGQNLAMGYDNWTQAIQGWIEEKEHYHYGYPSAAIVSHYTQV